MEWFAQMLQALEQARGAEWMFWLTRAVGIFGIFVNVAAFQCKKHSNLVLYKTLNEGAFGLQYLLLGAYTGFGMNVVSMVRNFLFRSRVKKGKSNLFFQIFFSVFFLIIGILTWDGPKSIIVILAKILTTVAYGISDTAKVRLLNFPSATAWMIYNSAVGSWEGALNEVFTLGSLVVGVIRLDLPEWREKRKRK